jgi:hypothetical protein
MMESFTGRFEGFARNSRAKRVYHETHQKHENILSRHWSGEIVLVLLRDGVAAPVTVRL